MPSIPDLAFAPPPAAQIDADAAREWIAALASDARESTQQLGEHVRRLNKAALLPSVRLEVMEVLRIPALERLARVDAALARAPQPLGIDDRALLFLARNLASGMAQSYDLALAALPEGGRDRRPVAPVLYNAVHFAAEALLASFRAYARVPAGAWKALHSLYLQAERRGIATGAADAATQQSITAAYAETLLVALTDPYRLAAGEVDRTLAVLRTLRAAPTLGREPPATHASGHFLVACDLDQAPRSALAAEDDSGGPNWRFFDAGPVVERLREALLELEAGRRMPAPFAEIPNEEARALAARLIRLWDDPPKRAYRRETASGTVAICVGVKPIAHFVAHDASADAEGEAAALRERLTMPLHSLPADEQGQLIPIHEWNVVNLSAGGMKVRRTASTTHPIAVGEVVGIKTPGKSLWKVGATRWINGLDDGGTEFGVQFFADAACAVWIKFAAPAMPPRLGLLVAAGGDAAEWVLAPAGTFTRGMEVELRGEGLRSRVRAVAPVESNGSFDLYSVEPT